MKPRNPYVMPARLRKAGPMKHRLKPRKESKRHTTKKIVSEY